VLVDLTEQFLGAYEYGRLAFSSPLSGGSKEHPTPTGDFKITAAHGAHWSSLYTFEGTDIPYPMTWRCAFTSIARGFVLDPRQGRSRLSSQPRLHRSLR
jgi:L,D-transpeptidase-like protein